ncbi:DUF721 domain-containing protein [Aurantimonas sp. A3-2-R12]|uniref:DUF721 domain-containing protein n=1 Tax=Aurantimonas sp. A3-2-R12 TaxID=3114362 RepID=UPI002E1721F0|nr:DciA family protein [Aurantimonas sp. A3-2-R12]
MKRRRAPSAIPVADLIGGLMDPILRRKAGMTSGLVAAWSEIAGPRLQDMTRPEKLLWPARRSDTDAFEPATLVVACEAAAALRLQHQTSELIARVNAFFGFAAVERIKIVQKAVNQARPNRKPKLRDLDPGDITRIDDMVARIEDPKLRDALRAFAETTLRRNDG